ncbi:MAG TPA: SH3 domain-containing protein [Hyphomicrobiaceae bacterium]|nr:SH3 domain-containing protein [Hyphomicrobiaceae bacterium]
MEHGPFSNGYSALSQMSEQASDVTESGVIYIIKAIPKIVPVLAILACGAGMESSPALARKGFDCAHGPDSYRVRNVPSWDRLNVRSGPGADNDIVGTISAIGSGILCTGPCKRNWCRIDWRGLVGWVNMRYLGE